MKTFPSLFSLMICVAVSTPFQPLHAARLSADFSPEANPSNGWHLGYLERLDGDFALYAAHYEGEAFGNIQAYWGWISDSESWVRQNLGPNEFFVPGQGTFPVRAVSAAAGYPERTDNFAVVRYVIPADGHYRFAVWGEATGSSDVDVHVSRDGVERVGRNLNPGESLGFTNEQFYATGTVIDIATGRGSDGSNYGAVFQFDAQIDPISVPSIPFADGLSSQFPAVTPTAASWTLGYKSAWDGGFTPYAAHFFGDAFGNAQAYWGRQPDSESFIRRNESASAFTVPGQGTFPPHGLSAAPGPVGAPDNYAVARLTIPSNGVYRVEVVGYASGWSDVDVHLIQDGVELLGRNLVTPEEIHLDEERFFLAGTVIDIAIGRGDDGSNYGAVFQFDARARQVRIGKHGLPEIEFLPAHGPFVNELAVRMVDRLGRGELRYTLDGTEPQANSLLYTEPFKIRTSTLVRAAAFANGGVCSEQYATAYQRVEGSGDGIPFDWLARYFGAGFLDDPRAKAGADPDGDGNTNLREYTMGSDPLDPLSGFSIRIKSAPCILFTSVPGQTYRILRRNGPAAENVEVGRVTATTASTRFIDESFEQDAGFYTVEPVR